MTSTEPRGASPNRRRWAFVSTVAVLAVTAFLVPQITSDNSQNSSGERSYFVYRSTIPGSGFDIPELITSSEAAVIGEVGETLAREYPRAYQQGDYSPEDWEALNQDSEWVERFKVVFHNISVQEVLYGEVPNPFPLLREDTEYYEYIDLSPLKTGENVLIFLSIKPGNPNFARSFDTFYTTFDNGLFDIEGNRAYPRTPDIFEKNEDPYYHRSNPLRPYFELDKLKAEIGNLGELKS